MRVLLISPFGSPAYGVSPYADSLLHALSDSAERCPTDELATLDFQSAYPQLLYPASMPSRKRQSGIHWAKPWTWRCPASQIDVAHLQYWTAATAPYLLRLVRTLHKENVKIITTQHNIRPHESSGILETFERGLLKHSDSIISHFETTEVRERLGKKLEVIPHGIYFKEQRRPTPDDYNLTGLNPEKRYCLYFGNIRPYKGVLDLLEAWPDLSSSFPNHELLIAGRVWARKGPAARIVAGLLGLNQFRQDYSRAKSRSQSQSIRFFNQYLSEAFIDACCRIAELSIFPYRHFDSQSGAATRVAGFGRRLLVSRTGALPELVNDARFTFEPGNSAELKDRLALLMSDSRKTIEKDEVRQLEHLRASSWQSVAAQHWNLYRRLIQTA